MTGASLDGKSPAKERQEDPRKSKPFDCSEKLANRQQNLISGRESSRYDTRPSSRHQRTVYVTRTVSGKVYGRTPVNGPRAEPWK